MPLLIRALILLNDGPTLMTSFNLNYFLSGSSPNIVTWGQWGASTYEIGGEGNKHSDHKISQKGF